ncbi:unnamed protein product [Calypogeia fissa]
MGGGGKRAFRVGAGLAKFVTRGLTDGTEHRLPSLGENLRRPPSGAVREFTSESFQLRRLRCTENGGSKEDLVRVVGFGSSLAFRRTFVSRSNRLGFSVEGPRGGQYGRRWFMEAANFVKVKPAVVSRVGGGIGAGQAAATSVVPGSATTGTINLTDLSGILQVVRFYGNCYRQLSKAHLSFFVTSTAAVGYVMGSGEVVDWIGLAWTSVGTMLAASSANAFNQILEVANDSRMKRTMRRPLPAGRMSTAHALAFAVTAGVTGVYLLASKTSAVAAELGAANILLYSLVYTPLKQIHHINTWVGAVVGGIPPLLGWAAASGQVDAGAWVLASALYFWQIPHFMALAFMFKGDYAAGGYRMLSLMDSSGKRTALCALRNCVYLLPLGILAQQWGTTSGYFGVENLVLTAGIGATAALFYLRPSPESARKLFRTSLLYLPILMTAMVIHRIPNPNVKSEQFATNDARETRELHNSPLRLPSRPTPDDLEQKRTTQYRRARDLPPPPISLLSAAPFPFLPAPDFY